MSEGVSIKNQFVRRPRSGAVLFSLLLWYLAAGVAYGQSLRLPEGLVNSQAAVFVLGQKNFSDITFGRTAERFGAISGLAVVGNKLILADSSYLAPPNNNRILIFNDLNLLRQRRPQDELSPADVVVGQADFGVSDPGTSATRMNQPVGVASDGIRLFVADWGNNRVLIYNRIPETSGAAADVVVGQPDFNSSGFSAGARALRRPNGVSSDGVRLFIADTLNNRVLIYQSLPTQNGAAADIVLGQPNFDSFQRLPTAAHTLFDPMSVTTDSQRLIVTDFGNNRVLIFNRIPTQTGATADVVVGQPDFTSNAAGNTATSLNFPRYAYSDGSRLVIVDSGNNRILIYNRIPTAHGAAADLVLGQADLFGLLESCAAAHFAVPYAAASDNGMLFVSDGFNRRVLGFLPGPSLVQSVLNGASFSEEPQTAACGVILPQPPVAPGGMAALFGRELADTTVQADSLPLPRELGGVKVRFNGIEAPLFYVSPTQISVQAPFELTGFSASLEIEKRTSTGTVVSAAVPVGLANGAPGIFTRDGTGSGQGLITHADLSPVTEDSPAQNGETLLAFVTGLGTVDHPVVNGTAAEFGASGSVTISGTAGADQTVTITVNGLEHSYTTVTGDTLDTIVQQLVDTINSDDPNVSATADVTNFQVKLRARVFGDTGANITYSASGSGSLAADVEGSRVVPGSVTIGGSPEPNQTITITLAGTEYSYTPVAGDTLETIVSQLAKLIDDSDPNVSAIADLDQLTVRLQLRDPDQAPNIPYEVFVSEGATLTALTAYQFLAPGVANATNRVSALIEDVTAPVTFAGLVKGAVGLYEVHFTVPANATPNPATALTLSQNLIVFGSVTAIDIFSNTVTFPIGE